MKPIVISPRLKRQRKMLLALPLLLVPFLTLFFWALGGGKGNKVQAAASQKGLNVKLPDARLKEDAHLNKLSYYQQAAQDSARLKQQMKSDPYYRGQAIADSARRFPDKAYYLKLSGLSARNTPTDDEAKVYQKLAQLRAAINKPQAQQGAPPAGKNTVLELPARPAPTIPPDPELTQMNGLLEKILDIQHPERLMPGGRTQAAPSAIKQFKAIPAVIDGTQKITQGTVIRIKLTDSITIGGRLFDKGQLLYGSGNLSNQRYTLNIKSLHIGTVFYPVDLTVFDRVDGLEGICVPEAITSDALAEGASNGVEGMEIMGLDQSMGTQIAGAGINAAKGLFSRKIKRVKGKLKNGHPLLLRINEKGY